MEDTEKKKVSGWTIVVFFVVLIVIFLHFPFIDYNGKKILVFAFEPLEEIVQGHTIFGRVIGSYTLETEYGEIRLKTLAIISAGDRSVSGIDANNFKLAQATHNLVVEGIELPRSISISFSRDGDEKK